MQKSKLEARSQLCAGGLLHTVLKLKGITKKIKKGYLPAVSYLLQSFGVVYRI